MSNGLLSAHFRLAEQREFDRFDRDLHPSGGHIRDGLWEGPVLAVDPIGRAKPVISRPAWPAGSTSGFAPRNSPCNYPDTLCHARGALGMNALPPRIDWSSIVDRRLGHEDNNSASHQREETEFVCRTARTTTQSLEGPF